MDSTSPFKGELTEGQKEATRRRLKFQTETIQGFETMKELYGLKNLMLLEERKLTLSQIRRSVCNDAMKCGYGSDDLQLGLMFDMMEVSADESVEQLILRDIEEYFFKT